MESEGKAGEGMKGNELPRESFCLIPTTVLFCPSIFRSRFPPSILHLKHSFPNEGDNHVRIFRIVKLKRHQDRQFSMHSFQVF